MSSRTSELLAVVDGQISQVQTELTALERAARIMDEGTATMEAPVKRKPGRPRLNNPVPKKTGQPRFSAKGKPLGRPKGALNKKTLARLAREQSIAASLSELTPDTGPTSPLVEPIMDHQSISESASGQTSVVHTSDTPYAIEA